MSGSMLNITPQTQVVLNDTAPLSARILPFSLTLTAAPQIFSLQKIVNSKQMTIFQGMYVDNSQCPSAANIIIGSQAIIVPAFAQGTFPIFVTSSMTLAFSGNGTVNFVLTNFPLHPNVWGTQPNALLGNGDAIVRQRAGTPFQKTISAIGSYTLIEGNPNAFITGIYVAASSPTGTAGGGGVNIEINSDIYIPTVNMSQLNTGLFVLSELTGLNYVCPDAVVDITAIGTPINWEVSITIFGGTTGVT